MNDRLKLLVQESKEIVTSSWDDKINKFILSVNDLYTLVTDAFLSVEEEKLVYIQSRQVSLQDSCGTYNINELYVDMGQYRFIFRPQGTVNYGQMRVGIHYVLHDGTQSPTYMLNYTDGKWMSSLVVRATTRLDKYGNIEHETFAITSPNDLADFLQAFMPKQIKKKGYYPGYGDAGVTMNIGQDIPNWAQVQINGDWGQVIAANPTMEANG